MNSIIKEGLFIILPFVFFGCSRTLAVTEAERYNDQAVEITARDSITYKLASGWKVDSLRNVSGMGVKIVSGSPEKFKGTVQSSTIERLTFVDSETPAIIVCMCALAALASVWLTMGKPN